MTTGGVGLPSIEAMSETADTAGDTADAADDVARRSPRSRAIWTIGDQAISSLSNAGLTIVLAKSVSARQYGAFAIGFSLFTLLQALSNATNGQVLIIRYSAAKEAVRRQATGSAAGAATALGVVAGLFIAVIGLALSPSLRSVLIATAIVMPALILQDTWRTAFIARGTPEQAFLNDFVWIAFQVVFMGALLIEDVKTSPPYIIAWGAAAAVAAVLGIRQAGTGPRPKRARAWVMDHRDINAAALGNAVATLGASQIAFLLIAGIGSVQDVGSLRAALTLLGPLNIIGFAATAFSIPEIIRRGLTGAALRKAAAGISGAILLVDAAWCATLLLLPDRIGVDILGATWHNTREALPGMVIFTCAIAITTGPTSIMRALDRTRFAFYNSLMLGPLLILGAALGTRIDDIRGTADGFAAAGVVVIIPTVMLMQHAISLGRRVPTA